jgi:3-oxoacyl-[acyl-carrier-protein] synthase-3
VLTALQIVDGFLMSRAIDCALVVASDADPGRGMSEDFPYSPTGAVLLCDWTDMDYGLEHISWVNFADDGETFNATVGLVDGHNVLRFTASDGIDEQFALAASHAVDECLRASSLRLTEVDVIVAAPARSRYRAGLAKRLGVREEHIVIADDTNTHTASLAAAFDSAGQRIRPGGRVLLVAAGAGIIAGAAIYRVPD